MSLLDAGHLPQDSPQDGQEAFVFGARTMSGKKRTARSTPACPAKTAKRSEVDELRDQLAVAKKALDSKVAEEEVARRIENAQRYLRVVKLLLPFVGIRQTSTPAGPGAYRKEKKELARLAGTILSIEDCGCSDAHLLSKSILESRSSISAPSPILVAWKFADASLLRVKYNAQRSETSLFFSDAPGTGTAVELRGEGRTLTGFTIPFWKRVGANHPLCQAARVMERFGAVTPHLMFASVCLKEPFFVLMEWAREYENGPALRRRHESEHPFPNASPMDVNELLDFEYSVLCEQAMGDIWWASYERTKLSTAFSPALQPILPHTLLLHFDRLCPAAPTSPTTLAWRAEQK